MQPRVIRDKILIVDDQENNRLVIEDVLRKLKCEIQMADSGEEALKVLKHWRPDLILMDQMMPGLSGIETVRHIKAQSWSEHIPILMVTAKDEAATLKEALEAGASDYITKPIERITLTARVQAALRTKKAFDQIKALTEELTAQKRELTNFTHMVSHDLKSPAASAASLFDFFLYRLKDEGPEILHNPNLSDLLLRIPGSLKKMLKFIDTMLNYAAAGKIVGDFQQVVMDHVLDEILAHFEHLQKEGVVIWERQALMPNVQGDALKLGQVWQNLIGNAIKYRGERTPVKVSLGWAEDPVSYRFWVQDDGPGIPAEHREAVFQPFLRFNDEVEGSGVGLATVQQVIQAHRGQIFVDPEYESGARFIFVLPKTSL